MCILFVALPRWLVVVAADDVAVRVEQPMNAPKEGAKTDSMSESTYY